MAFDYIFPNQPMSGLDYNVVPQAQEQPSQQQGGMNPQALTGLAKTFMGGAEGAGSAGTGTGSGSGSAGAGVAEGAASQSGPGIMSQLSTTGASAGPWAALAAVIIANEAYASDKGYRDEDKMQYAKDIFSGEVFHQDVEKRFLPEVGIDEDSKTSKRLSFLLHPMGMTGDLGETWDCFTDMF